MTPPATNYRAPSPELAASADCAATPSVEYDAVYRDHFDFVWRNARRLGVPEDLADDAVQDVFVIVHRRLAEFEGRSALRTWLYSIVVHVARDYRRADNRRRAKAAALASEVAPARPPTPADLADRREAARILDGLLARLDEQKREVFVLVELEQMSVAEAAEALSLNVNTAHARLRAGRQQFEAAAAQFRAKERL